MNEKNKRPMTDKQRQARLENIKKAGGPKTIVGKARSAQNATKHGYWARGLKPLDRGPLREDPAELAAFVDAFIDELTPGKSLILRQAALDVADKAWRLSRVQRWEAEGFSNTDYGTPDAAQAALLRFGAGHDRRHAEAVRLFPDRAVSDDDLEGAFCALAFAVGLSEEDLDWLDEWDRAAVVEALTVLIDEHFADQEEAASYLDEKAVERDAQASEVEDMWRPGIIRQEMDGSFARNAERLVSHASREYDRSLKRYQDLVDRFGLASEQSEDDDDPGLDGGSRQPGGGNDPDPAGGAADAADKFDIWSFMTADEVVDYLSNLDTSNTPGAPSRNEPTERTASM